MKILLVCSAGMSTSLLEKSINEHMKSQGVEGYAIAHGSGKAKQIIDDYDVILLGPQVRFMLEEFKSLASQKPIAVIPPGDYALAKGVAVFKLAQSLVNQK